MVWAGAAPVIAGSGPLAPIVAGGLGVAGLLGWLLSRDKKDQPTPMALNPITGQPVPKHEDGSYWGIDPGSGLPGQLIDQIWGATAPEGLSTPGMTADQFVQGSGRLPFWANNRLVSMSKELGGWDKLVEWAMNPAAWASIMTVLGQPWGQGEYDQMPAGYTPDMGAAQPPAGNEGAVVNTPEGQAPSGVDAQGNPVYGTTVTGDGGGSIGLPLGVGAAAGAGILGSVLAGGGQGGGFVPTGSTSPAGTQPTSGTPVFKTDVWGTSDSSSIPSFSTNVNASLFPPATPAPGLVPTGTPPSRPPVNGPWFGGPLGEAAADGLGAVLGGLIGSLGGGQGFQQKQPSQEPGRQPGSPSPINLVVPPSTTTSPAPYATLPGQTPVQSVFGFEPGLRRSIPSLGMLLKGLAIQ